MKTNEARTFFSLVKDNKMLEAKAVFESRMKEIVAATVSSMNKEVAKNFFTKKNK